MNSHIMNREQLVIWLAGLFEGGGTFNFYKEVELDKSLFETNIPFEINYATNHDNQEQKFQINKKEPWNTTIYR